MKRTGYVYDEEMTKHRNPDVADHVEGPHRITVPYQTLTELSILQKCQHIKSRQATKEELALVHTEEYISQVEGCTSSTESAKVSFIPERWPSYACDATYKAASIATGSLLNLVDSVCSREIDNGVALVRPPGHHAEMDASCGFCFFNSVAIATRYAQQTYNHIRKVLIVDWDIHHGNGIQHCFYDDPSVLYVSLHRYDNGEYFPHLRDADCDYVGENQGEGYNVNIAWNKDLMGDLEYKTAFDEIVLPVAREFQPDLVLVASGFDAAAADPLGQYILTPAIFAYMTERLVALAEGRLVLSLEGGYDAHTISQCLQRCMQVLLGDAANIQPDLGQTQHICKRAQQTLTAVKTIHSKYWSSLQQ